MSSIYTKQPNGSCPYCGGNTFGTESDRRSFGAPDIQQIAQCSGCSLWSMRNTGTGVRYPLQDPSDSASTPAQQVIVDD